jgi:hypothetical protein
VNGDGGNNGGHGYTRMDTDRATAATAGTLSCRDTRHGKGRNGEILRCAADYRGGEVRRGIWGS